MSGLVPLIPQNESNFYKFVKEKNFYAVDLLFDHSQEVNLENLYLIFKSYLHNEENVIHRLLIVAKVCAEDIGRQTHTFHNVKINKMKLMSYVDFIDWYENIYENDYEYLKNYKYYGFRFCFFKKSKNWELLLIYPHYP